MAQAQSKRVYSLEGPTPMIVHAGRVGCPCARAKLAQARRGPEAYRPISHHGAYSARCMKSVLHAAWTIWWLVVTQRRWPPTTCANCQCRRLCWTMCDPYEKQLLMISDQNVSCVGRLRGDGPALAPPLPCSIRAVAHAACRGQAMTNGPIVHGLWPSAHDSWFELRVES